jgi:NTE family protein
LGPARAIADAVEAPVHAVRAPGERPRIGLALSGGGARGFAHVGVLQVLEELRIPVDYVAGTSMGAIVGGLYAAGLSPDELGTLVIDVDWLAAFDDRTERQNISFRRKQDSFDFLTSLRVWIKDLKIALPRGLIAGQRLGNLLAEVALPAATVRNFDDLPIPFRAVATDTATGDAVSISTGELVRAMWASMAVPAVFSPVEIDGKLLVDGGVANNLPIDVVRAMGADIVIAVDIAGRLAEGEVRSVLDVSGQSLTVLMLRNTDDQIATLTERDLLIQPDLGSLGSASFEAGAALVEAGAEGGLASKASLEQWSLSEEDYAEYRAGRPQLPREAPVVTSVRYDNRSPLSDFVIEERFDILVGQPLDLVELEHDMAFLYGEEIFDRVTFALEATDEGTELVLRTYGKEQGRNFLRFGLRLEADFDGESKFDIAALLTRNPMNRWGGEWRSKLQFGDVTGFQTEFFQPFTPRSRFFVLPSFSIGLTTRDVFGPDGGDRLAKYRIRDLDAQVAIGTHISNVAEIKIGGGYRLGDLDRTSGDPNLFDDANFDGFAAFGRVTYDTLDSVVFPRSGGYAFVSGEYLPDALGADDGLERVQGSGHHAFSFGETTFLPSIGFGTTFDGDDALPTYSLGGFLKLSGTAPESRTGSSFLLGRLIAYHRIANPRVFSWSFPVYLGASFEFGNTYEDLDELDGDSLDLAGSVFFGVDTFLGPIYIAYGHAEGGNDAGYVFLGQVF